MDIIHIGAKFTHPKDKKKVYEIIDITNGATKEYCGEFIFYKTVKGSLKVKTVEDFVKKFMNFM